MSDGFDFEAQRAPEGQRNELVPWLHATASSTVEPKASELADATDESTDSDELDEVAAVDDELAGLDEDLAALYAQPTLFDVDEHLVEETAELAHSVYSNTQIIDAAHEHFRREGFPLRKIPLYLQLQVINKLAQTSSEALLQSALGYSVADTYHPHRLAVRIGNRPSPFMAFQDDAKFRHALRLCIEQKKVINETELLTVLQLVRGAQAAANFRPGFALAMYRRFAEPDGVVLDTSMGFGGRLVGFLASRCKHYIGIDPAKLQFDGNTALANALCDPERQSFTLWPYPAEDVDAFSIAITETCDFAFTSPPYFSKEHYSDEPTQSWKRYPSGEGWRVGFLVPMMQLNFDALKPDTYCCINIADVKIDGKDYPLAQWTEQAGRDAGFHFVGIERFPIHRGFGQGQKKEAFEPVLMFRKES